jgi:hypothetical protein
VTSRELADLLVALLGSNAPKAAALGALDRASGKRFLQASAKHGVAPLLYRSLSASGGDVPPELLARLHDIYLHSSLRNQALRDDAAAVFGALREAGVRAIALKGVHLAFAVYPDPALRPMNDIDLLVSPQEDQRAAAVLRGLGYGITDALGKTVDYTALHHARPVIKSGSVQVEVHHRLELPGSPFSVDQDGIRSRARAGDGMPGGPDVFSPEDLLLHVCAHIAYNHAFDVRLLALQDVRQVLRRYGERLDWTRARAIAEADGRAPFVGMALAVTERLWPGSVPERALASWPLGEEDAEVRDAAVEYVKQMPVELPVGVRRMRSAGSARERIVALLEAVFPSPERMREIYQVPASRSVVWSYLWRPLDVLRRRWLDLVRLTAGNEAGMDALARDDRQRVLQQWLASKGGGGLPT